MTKTEDQLRKAYRLEDGTRKLTIQAELEGKAQMRAATFAGFFLAGATALLVASLDGFEDQPALAFAAMWGAAFFYAGALLCALAAWPGRISTPGESPRYWKWLHDNPGEVESVEDDLIERMEQAWAKNRQTAHYSRLWFTLGAGIGLLAPVIMWVTYQASA